MTGPISTSVLDREIDKFVESSTRANKTAVEVYVGNASAISGGPGSNSINVFNDYQELTSVVNGVTATVLTHTFSAIDQSKLCEVSVSGTNFATYELLLDSALIEKKRTHFGGPLSVSFEFQPTMKVSLGSVLELKVIHSRPTVGDFNATVKYTEGL